MKNDKLYTDVHDFLSQSNPDLINENANKDKKVVITHRDTLAGILSKNYADSVIPEDLMKWHNDGYGHIHDLDYYISPLTNCCLVNYQDMLQNGFKLGNAQIESPKSFMVACTVLTQIILAVASSQYGGQSIGHIDIGLEPYVQKSWEKLLKKQKKYNLSDEFIESELVKEVYDGMQTFLYQTNSTVSTGSQTPFVTISLGLGTSKFSKMITEQYLKVHMKGLGKEEITPVFPKVVFFLEDGVNLHPEDINYDLKQKALECSTKRIYPDFVSVPQNREVTGSSSTAVTPMGCRSYLSKWENENGEEQYDGRFNLGVVSLNLPLIALECDSEGEFFKDIQYHMDMAFKAQMNRVERLKGTLASQNPTLFTEGAISRLSPNETIEKLFYNGYASISIGYVGLAECSEILKGTIQKEFCQSILSYMKSRCQKYYDNTNIAFSLYGTPAESLCYKFAKCIELKYPSVLKRDFVTNSFHQPVWVSTSPFEKFDYESNFAVLSNGGNISYVETPNLANNLPAMEALVDYAYHKINYFGINQSVDKCHECKYNGEFTVSKDGFSCPSCGNTNDSTMSVIRRVSGYLGNPSSRGFNKGKQQECIQRIKHK